MKVVSLTSVQTCDFPANEWKGLFTKSLSKPM